MIKVYLKLDNDEVKWFKKEDNEQEEVIVFDLNCSVEDKLRKIIEILK